MAQPVPRRSRLPSFILTRPLRTHPMRRYFPASLIVAACLIVGIVLVNPVDDTTVPDDPSTSPSPPSPRTETADQITTMTDDHPDPEPPPTTEPTPADVALADTERAAFHDYTAAAVAADTANDPPADPLRTAQARARDQIATLERLYAQMDNTYRLLASYQTPHHAGRTLEDLAALQARGDRLIAGLRRSIDSGQLYAVENAAGRAATNVATLRSQHQQAAALLERFRPESRGPSFDR